MSELYTSEAQAAKGSDAATAAVERGFPQYGTLTLVPPWDTRSVLEYSNAPGLQLLHSPLAYPHRKGWLLILGLKQVKVGFLFFDRRIE